MMKKSSQHRASFTSVQQLTTAIKGLAPRSTRFAPLQGWLWHCQLETEPKRRPHASRALDPHLPVMLLNNGPTNVQPQAQFDPSATLDLDPFDLVEAFPDVLLFL